MSLWKRLSLSDRILVEPYSDMADGPGIFTLTAQESQMMQAIIALTAAEEQKVQADARNVRVQFD